VTPILFGPAHRPLFGLHHPPAGEPRDVGVLLCHPAPQEYQLTHWSFRNLAGLLAREGFHVFRFDYTGTGDSGGDLGDAGIPQWRADVRTAATELRDVAGVSRLACVGLRLGASLAALASEDGLEAEALVLWDPVLSGARWVAECRALEDSLFTELLVPASTARELVGYPFPAALEVQLRGLDLSATAPPPAGAVHVIAAEDRPDARALVARWSASQAKGGPAVRHTVVREEGAGGSGGALLGGKLLGAITGYLAEVMA
jgi:alpha/beta superfamily hydrolase